MIVARREEHHFLGFRGLHDFARVRSHARAAREYAKVERFEHREGIVGPFDEEHCLPRLHLFSIIERVHHELVPPLGA